MVSSNTLRRPPRARAAVLGMLASVSSASAESPPAYEAPAECQTRDAWIGRLRARLAPELRTTALVETLSVRVTGSAHRGYAGLVSSTVEASLNGRELQGDSCDDVLDALGFVAALWIERSGAAPWIDRSGAREPTGTGVIPASPALTLEATRAAAPVEDVPEQNAAAERGATVSTLAFAQLQPGLTPASALEVGAALRIAWSTPAWQPLLSVAVYSAMPRQLSVSEGGSVRLSHWSSQWLGCPWRFPRQGMLALRPCLELELGRSSGQGLGVADAAKYSAPWVSGGAQLRAEIELGRHWALGASADAVVPFWRSHFYLVPDRPIFDTPGFGVRAGVSAGLIF